METLLFVRWDNNKYSSLALSTYWSHVSLKQANFDFDKQHKMPNLKGETRPLLYKLDDTHAKTAYQQ